MKRMSNLATVVAVLGLAWGCASAPQVPDAEAMVASANALDQSFLEAFNRGDVEAVSSLYWDSPDVVSFPVDALQARGMGELKAAAAQSAAAMPGARLELTESHQMPAGDVVIGWGLWRVTVAGPDGAPVEVVGRYTDVKAERDGTWVYILDHASAPLPPPPAN
jgi:ketosteroid isomerase-like protein